MALTLLCCAVGVWEPAATAGDWDLTNRISLSSYLSDNIAHREDGNAGMGVDIRPSIGLQGQGRRLRGSLSYTPSLFTAFGEDVPPDRLSHYLRSAFHGELVRDQLFFDASANAGLVTTDSVASAGDSSFTTADETTQTFGLSLSPYTRHRFGSHANLSLRLGLNAVWSESETDDINSTGRSASAVLSSGAQFTRLPWSLVVARNETEYEARTDIRDSVSASLGYRIDRKWRVDGSFGYERNDVDSSRDSTSGSTYSATVLWTPNPRNRGELEIGKRYFGTFVRGHGEHRSRRTVLTLDARHEVTNVRSQLLNPITIADRFEEAGEEVPEILNPDFVVDVDLLPIDEDFLVTELTGAVRVTGRRSTLTATANWSDRSYEVTPREERLMGLTLRGTRRLGGQIAANATVRWQDVQSNAAGDSQFWLFSVGASRSLGRHTRVGLDLSRQQRTGDVATSEFTEHRIGVTVTTRMF